MKRIALAMAMVLAFSSAAFAINYSSVSVTLSGSQQWINGAINESKAQNDNTLKLSTTDAKNNWKANVEYSFSTGVQNKADQNNVPKFTLNDVYFQVTAQPFTFEVWNWGEDGQGVDYKTPMEFVFSNDAPDKNWKGRVTTDLGGNKTVLDVKNDKATPDYFLFTQREIGKTTVGAAYRTFFNHRNIIDGWATSDLGVAKVTGEVARVSTPAPVYGDESKFNFAAKVELPSNIILTGRQSNAHVAGTENYTTTYAPIDGAKQQIYLEANVFQLARVSYTFDEAPVADVNLNIAGKKNTYDIRVRKSNDQAIGDIWNVDNDFFDINVSGDNDWLKNKGWAFGVNYVDEPEVVKNLGTVDTKDDKDFVAGDPHQRQTINVYAQFAPTENISVFGKVTKVAIEEVAKPHEYESLATEIRGYYKFNNQLALHPRYFVYDYEDPAKKDSTKLGSFISYTVSRGMLMGGLWLEKVDGEDGANKIIEAGYELSF